MRIQSRNVVSCLVFSTNIHTFASNGPYSEYGLGGYRYNWDISMPHSVISTGLAL